MIELFEVEFKGRRAELFINPRHIPLRVDEYAVVEAERGEDIGLVRHKIDVDVLDQPYRVIYRSPTERDREALVRNRRAEKEAFRCCKQEIAERSMGMKLIDAEYQLDRKKLSFYFTADGRIDFRALVRALAAIYRTRIEMRQIGVRDAASRLGGVGGCGRLLCCASFLKGFVPITTQMVKEQDLDMSSSRLTGLCGRLKCCILYEMGMEEEIQKRYQSLAQMAAEISLSASQDSVDQQILPMAPACSSGACGNGGADVTNLRPKRRASDAD